MNDYGPTPALVTKNNVASKGVLWNPLIGPIIALIRYD